MPITQRDDLKQELGKSLADMCIGIRDRRRTVEQQWLLNRRMIFNKEIERRYIVTDTASGPYNVPSGRRSAERTIVRTVKMLTPKVKWFELQGMNEDSDKKAGNVDKFMSYILRKKIASRSNIGQLARSMFICGMATQKTSSIKKNNRVWPSQRVIDPFAYYIYPETSAVSNDAEVQFEDLLLSYEKYKSLVTMGIMDDIQRSDLTDPEWPYHLTERLAYQGITTPNSNIDLRIGEVESQLKRTTAAFCSITEMWITHEDKVFQVYHLWNTYRGPKCVGFFQSEYDEPLYRTSVHRGIAGELYTTSMAEDITGLDFLQNDLVNKFLEQVDREQGIYAINSPKRHDSWKVKGGAVWLFDEDPRMVLQFIQPPVVSTNILRAWQIVSGMVNTMGGTGTIAEGSPGRNMPRAGSAVQSLLEMGMADVSDVAELIEQEILTPGLSDVYKVSIQFIPDAQLLRVPGGEGLANSGMATPSILRKENILGDYEFEWIGTLQSQDHEDRAQRTMIFLNLLSNPQLAQQLSQQGYAINLPELIKTIWRDQLGERGLADIILPMSDMDMVIAKTNAGKESSANTGIGSTGTGNSPPVPGLNYNLPSVTNGFVRQ